MIKELISAGIPDNEFIRDTVPMTKMEVRVISISKLQITEGDRVMDIGAGTGSVSIEIARLLPNSTVYAVEHKAKAVDLIKQNAQKFNTLNLEVIHGKAPEVLTGLKHVNKFFIGGSSGNLVEILDWIVANGAPNSHIVVNAVTLETLTLASHCLSGIGFSDLEIIQVAINRVEELGGVDMFRAMTPVFVISARRMASPSPSKGGE